MLSINYSMAKKEKLQFILSGSNTSTECGYAKKYELDKI